MYKKLLIIFFSLLFFSSLIFAELPREPQSYAYGGGPRAFNMGFAGVADAFDTSALYLNPSGLGQIEDYEFTLQYASFLGYNDLFGAFGIPIGKRQALGISFKWLSLSTLDGSSIQNTYSSIIPYDESILNNGREDTQISGHIGYGIGVSRKLRFGGSIKIFNQSMETISNFFPVTYDNYDRTELGFDAGFQWDIAYFFSFGLHIRNAFSLALKNSPSTDRNFPLYINPGISFRAFNDRLIINADVNIPTVSVPILLKFGFSFRITKWFYLYGGASTNFYGGGIDLRPFEELIFFFGLAYHKVKGEKNFDSEGGNERSELSFSLGVTFLIRKPSKKINREVRDYLRAQRAMRRGEYGRAAEILQDIARSDPENRDLNELTQDYLRLAQRRAVSTDWMTQKIKARIAEYMKQGKENYSRGDYAKSIRAFRKVLDIYPPHEEANEWYNKVRKRVYAEATRWYKIGEKYYIDGDLQKAEYALRKCLRIDPEYTPARELLKRLIGGGRVAALREGIRAPIFNRYQQGGRQPGQTGPGTGPGTSPDGSRTVITPRNESDKIFQRGEAYYFQAKYLLAITTLKKFIDKSENEELKLKAKELIAKAKQKYDASMSTAAKRKRSARLFKLGMAAYNQKRYRDAANAFAQSFEADNTNLRAKQMERQSLSQLTGILRALLNEGIALRDKKDYDAAIAKFRQVLQTDKEHELSIKAEQLLKATIQERKGAVGRHLAIARDALKNRQYQAALTNFNIVLQIQPNNKEALIGRRKALRLFQGRINDLLSKGRTELKNRNYPQAIVFFDKVLSIDRNNRAAIQGKKQAQDLMERASARRSVKENLEIAKLRFENRDYELALQAINRILKVQPRNRAALVLKRKCQKQLEYEKERRKIMKLFSEGARAFRKRNYDQAILKWRQVLKLQVRSPEFDASIIREYIKRAQILKKEAGNIALKEGDKYFKAKKYKKARKSYKEALNVNPNSNAIRIKLTRVEQIISQLIRNAFKEGENQFNKGNYQKAIEAYKTILDYEDEGELANTAKDELQRAQDAFKAKQKADKHMQKREYADAITQYEYLIAINRNDAYAKERRREAIVALSRRAQKIKADAIKYLKNKNYVKAIALLQIVVRFDRDDAEAKARLAQAKREAQVVLVQNYRRGIRAYNARNWKVAVNSFKVVRSINPNYKQVNKFYRRSLDNYNQIVARRSAARQGTIQSLFYQGITLYRQNKLRAAIAVWNRILAIDPSNAKARQYIQRARFRLGG